MTAKPTRMATAKLLSTNEKQRRHMLMIKQYLNMNKLNINNQQTLALSLNTYILLQARREN
jgi:hypothetical protein